jgi:hypothetical protein
MANAPLENCIKRWAVITNRAKVFPRFAYIRGISQSPLTPKKRVAKPALPMAPEHNIKTWMRENSHECVDSAKKRLRIEVSNCEMRINNSRGLALSYSAFVIYGVWVCTQNLWLDPTSTWHQIMTVVWVLLMAVFASRNYKKWLPARKAKCKALKLQQQLEAISVKA